MTRRFYGVYLKSEAISTVLDLVRFLGEPNAIRLSHITLRGPYASKMRATALTKFNNDPRYDWSIEMIEPITFLSPKQSTVAISVDLLSLNGLLRKPDFPDGVPHITLYDGRDRAFAEALFELLRQYDWQRLMRVGKLREVARGDKLDQVLVPLFKNFDWLFRKLVGPSELVGVMHTIRPSERLTLIGELLEQCVEAAPLPRAGRVAQTLHAVA
jgi:hypothetical protein